MPGLLDYLVFCDSPHPNSNGGVHPLVCSFMAWTWNFAVVIVDWIVLLMTLICWTIDWLIVLIIDWLILLIDWLNLNWWRLCTCVYPVLNSPTWGRHIWLIDCWGGGSVVAPNHWIITAAKIANTINIVHSICGYVFIEQESVIISHILACLAYAHLSPELSHCLCCYYEKGGWLRILLFRKVSFRVVRYCNV